MMIVMSDRVVSITLYFSVSFRLTSLDSQLCGSADRVKVDHDGLLARKIRAIGGYAGTPQGCSVKSLWRAYILVSPHARRVYSCTLLTCVPSVLRLAWLRRLPRDGPTTHNITLKDRVSSPDPDSGPLSRRHSLTRCRRTSRSPSSPNRVMAAREKVSQGTS